MAGTIFSVILGVTAVLFYLNDNFTAAAVLAGWTLYRILQGRLSRLIQVLSRMGLDVPSEQNCNTAIEARIVLQNVFAHPAVKAAFVRLKGNGIVQADSFEDWTKTLLANFRRKYARENDVEVVRFNIKSGVLFRDGVVDFGDTIYHEIAIPYVDGQRREMGMFSIHSELSVRLLMVNGILVLQVGDFDKTTTPNILKDGSLAVYEKYSTITRFPFLYFSHRHGLPVRYLNLSSHATESYKEHHRTGKAKHMFDDWKKLHQDLRTYRALCDSDSTGYSKWERLSKKFEAERDELLNAEHFKSVSSRDADDSWRYPDWGDEYSNDYLWVTFRDFNLNREFAAHHWFTDYYEEMP